jgi:predicted PurR-regulated permease PerM
MSRFFAPARVSWRLSSGTRILREMTPPEPHETQAAKAIAAIAEPPSEATLGAEAVNAHRGMDETLSILTRRAPRVTREMWTWGIAAIAVAVAFVYLLGPILSPFLFGAVLAYIGSPVVAALARRRVPRMIGALLVVTGMIAIVAILIVILMPMVQHEVAAIARRLPELADRFNERFVPWLRERFGIDLQFDPASMRAFVAENVSGVQNIGVWLLGSLRIGGMALVGFFANLLLTPVVMFYLLLDWDALVARLASLLPRRWDASARQIAGEIDRVLAEYLRGQVTVMGILAIYYAAALWLVGLQFAVPIGVLTGLLIFIPYLGFGVGLILALLVALLQFATWQGVIFVLIVYGIGQLIESFVLTPWLVGERIGLHPLAVIFALLAFGQLFGFTGVLIALPASAAILVGLRHVRMAYTNSALYRDR